MADTLITGAYDMHIHVGPDILERKLDFLDMAERAKAAGMAGYVIKSHYFPASSWAKVATEKVPGVKTYGSITLNNSVGGMNPYAVDAAARDGAKVVWFPTVDTVAAQKTVENPPEREPYWLKILISLNESKIGIKPVSLLDEAGKLLPEVHDVLDVIASYDMLLCTGHISALEGMKVLEAAKEHGVQRLVCTHVDSELCFYTIEQQKEVIRKYGAFVEHCYNEITTQKVPEELCYEQIKAIGCDHIILSTDRGQKKYSYPDEALLEFAEWMVAHGFSETDTRKTMVNNPDQLLN